MTATYHQVLNRVGSLEHGHHARRTKLKRKAPRLAYAALGKRQNARGFGKVTRSVSLPDTVDPSTITAELTNGVLHVTITKRPESQPKKIEVKIS
jgi:hypothetical protein